MECKRSPIKLDRFETYFYFGAWISAVLYSIYCVHLATEKYFQNYIDSYNDFSPGWSFLHRKQDISDYEWKMWVPLIHKLVPWIFAHVFISQCIKKFFDDTVLLCIFYITISVTYLCCNFGLLSTLCTLVLPCISCLLTSIRSKVLCWFVHSVTLAFINWIEMSGIPLKQWLTIDDNEYYLLIIAICWIQLKSISYSIDSIESYKYVNIYGFFQDLINNVAYCIYLPTLFFGPVVLYNEFIDGIKKPFTPWNKEKLLKYFLILIRYTFWMYFTEFCLHFIYFNALKFHPNTVMKLGPWAFYGLGYCMGQHFLNKYVVVYGLSSTICRAEDIEGPPQPKCIGRIHLYSDMWKHFDRGLYKFLLRYIYIPCNPKTSFGKIFASALCFTFIYFWHGLQMYIFIWAFLNFIGIVIESIANSSSKYFYKNILGDNLSLQNKRRLECLLASPLLVMSAISNFYFFGNEIIGHAYIWRIFQEPWQVYIILILALYCCCQTSTEIKQIEEVNSLKSGRMSKSK